MEKLRARFARRLVCGLISFELCLVLLYWGAILAGEPRLLHALVNLDGEANIPTWFSSSQLLFAGLITWSAALLHQRPWKPSRPFLWIAGLVLVLMSLDETAQIHESITACLQSRYVDWVPPFLLENGLLSALACFAIFIVIRLVSGDLAAIWRWSRRDSLIALAGVGLFLSGAGVLETVGYKFLQGGTFIYQAEVTAEEFLEMMGASCILYTVTGLALDRLRPAEMQGVSPPA